MCVMTVLAEGLKNMGVHIVIQGLLNELILFLNMVKYSGMLVPLELSLPVRSGKKSPNQETDLGNRDQIGLK